MSASATPPPTLTTMDAQGRGLCVRFHWRGDRYAHRIEAIDSGATDASSPIVAGESMESDHSDPWPHSPPIQQLSIEPIGASMAALGVGAAGRGHWSLSVVATEIDQRPALVFDVAARAHADPGPVGSRYRAVGEELEIRPLPEVAPTRVTQSDDGVYVIEPEGPASTTRRWAYAILIRPEMSFPNR